MGKVLLSLFILSAACFSLEASTPCQLDLKSLIQQETRALPRLPIEKIRISAIVVAENRGKLLLGYRIGHGANEKNTWGFAGGKMESLDQNLLAAAVREFLEETGLTIDGSRLKYIGRLNYEGSDDKFYASHFYYLHLEDHELPNIPENEITRTGAWEFFDLNNPPLHMFSTNKVLFRYFKRFGFKPKPQ